MNTMISVPKSDELKFTKTDTDICKGIAILFMVLHHTIGLYYNHFDLSWYVENTGNIFELILVFFSSAGKVCVCLLTLLSGYGLSKSYEKYRATSLQIKFSYAKFSISHYVQFWSLYLVAFIINNLVHINATVSLLYAPGNGLNIKNLLLFAADSTGISKFVTGSNWYVRAIIIMYFLFPLIYWLTSKIKFGAVVILYAPWILKLFIKSWNASSDQVLFYLFAFALGIYFAQNNTFEKIRSINSSRYKLFSTLFLLAAFSLRLIFSLRVDIIFAVAIVNFEISVLRDLKTLNKPLTFFGKHSANIWLLHGSLLFVLRKIPNIPTIVLYVLAFSGSLMMSVIIERIKEITRYNALVKKIRKAIA